MCDYRRNHKISPKRWFSRLGVFILAVPLNVLITLSAFSVALASGEAERIDGKTWRMVTDTGEVIFETSLTLNVGDEFIAEDNTHYRVTRTQGDEAFVVKVGRVALHPGNIWETALHRVLAQRRGGVIGIYHTHSDESYRPTSGQSSKKLGDILKVGKALKEALEKEGYQVVYSDANHAPHDGAAYHRSRRTAMQILRYRPLVLIDVHRDAGPPPSRYRTTVGKAPAAKITLVVGRQNQHYYSNFEFAKAIKRAADAQYQGLIKGILWAGGNYNQDLGPRTLLMEFGTDGNSLAEAERAAAAIAKVFPAVVTPTGRAVGNRAGESMTGASGRTALWLIVGVLVIGGLYLLLNKAPR